jgi:hypothetical protein
LQHLEPTFFEQFRTALTFEPTLNHTGCLSQRDKTNIRLHFQKFEPVVFPSTSLRSTDSAWAPPSQHYFGARIIFHAYLVGLIHALDQGPAHSRILCACCCDDGVVDDMPSSVLLDCGGAAPEVRMTQVRRVLMAKDSAPFVS